MKYRGLLILGAWLCAASAHAGDPGLALAQRSVCMACHQVDIKRVGPSFRDIALRYATNEGAVSYLTRSIREGSRGLWGAIPMPAQRHVDPATAILLAEWIVSLAPRTEMETGKGAEMELDLVPGDNTGSSPEGIADEVDSLK